jgi:GWxTD domain-containing protein
MGQSNKSQKYVISSLEANMSIYIKKYKFILITLILISSNLGAQDRFRMDKLQPFDFDIVSLPNQNGQQDQLNIYIWVRNTQLQFIKSDTVYKAHYQINIEVYPANGNKEAALLTRDTTTTITEAKYSATIDPKTQHDHFFKATLPPMEYLFRIRLLDLNSKSSRIEELKKKVEKFSDQKLLLSDILIITKNNAEVITDKDVLPPNRITMSDNIYLFTNIISPEGINEFRFNADLVSKTSGRIFQVSETVPRKSMITPIIMPLDKSKINRGDLELKLTISAGQQHAEKSKMLRFISSNDKASGAVVQDMVEPLTYIGYGDELNKIRQATGEDREQLFKTFWDKRDPTEGTPENELYDEFYRRVDFVNQNFTQSKIAGWRNDRGHVYIIYGAPDNIERSTPSSYDPGNYEIWYYTDLNKKFVFLDERGFGDYRLVSGTFY